VSWSPSENAAVLYRVANGVALACGDPVGDPEGHQAAIAAWLESARTRAWVPAVVGASRSAAAEYGRAGLKVLAYGDEAVIEVASFAVQGEATPGLYAIRRRVRGAGYTVVVRRHRGIPEPEMVRLAHLANAWRHGTADRGLAMALGRLGDPADGACVMVECRDVQDRTCALMSLVPWGRTGLTLDLMRRDRESAEELTQFMIIELLLRARGDAGHGHEDGTGAMAGTLTGVERVSLNLTTFHAAGAEGTTGGRPGTGPVFRLYRGILRVVSRRQHLAALHHANAAFRPHWEPRFMLYERRTELPRIAIADATAEGFVMAPRLRFSEPK
jgi:lysyl-tRNA synthetase class 2